MLPSVCVSGNKVSYEPPITRSKFWMCRLVAGLSPRIAWKSDVIDYELADVRGGEAAVRRLSDHVDGRDYCSFRKVAAEVHVVRAAIVIRF